MVLNDKEIDFIKKNITDAESLLKLSLIHIQMCIRDRIFILLQQKKEGTGRMKYKYICDLLISIGCLLFNAYLITLALYMCINYSLWWILLLVFCVTPEDLDDHSM